MDRRKKYEAKRVVIQASLRTDNHADMIEYLEDKKPISTYIINLIKKDMRK